MSRRLAWVLFVTLPVAFAIAGYVYASRSWPVVLRVADRGVDGYGSTWALTGAAIGLWYGSA